MNRDEAKKMAEEYAFRQLVRPFPSGWEDQGSFIKQIAEKAFLACYDMMVSQEVADADILISEETGAVYCRLDAAELEALREEMSKTLTPVKLIKVEG